jgi:uncharacterized RDD family membrane protein YckC
MTNTSLQPTPITPIAPTAELSFASFGQRLMASISDQLILAYIPILNIWYLSSASTINDFFYRLITTFILIILPFFFFRVVYFTWFIAQLGATPGKQIWGVQVQDEEGKLLGLTLAFFREFVAKGVSAFSCYLGFLWMIKHPQKQTWHDLLVGTRVINIKHQFGLAWLITLALLIGQIVVIGVIISKIPSLADLIFPNL